jgi:DNA repair photolyase
MSAIYEPNGKAREYSPLALNYYKGCTHNCKYCYVPSMFNRWGDYDHSNQMLLNPEQKLKEIENSAKKFQNDGRQVLLNFTSDPYNSLESELRFTRKVLLILLKYQIPTAILSKGGNRILADLDIFKRFGNLIKVGSTLTFDNDKDSLEWESGASLPSERLKVLETLHNEGVKTWVSFEPVIIPEQTLTLAKKCVSFVDQFKIGKLNNYKGIDKTIDWTDFLNKIVKIMEDNNKDYYIKKDLLKFNTSIEFAHKRIDSDYLAIKKLTNQLF